MRVLERASLGSPPVVAMVAAHASRNPSCTPFFILSFSLCPGYALYLIQQEDSCFSAMRLEVP